MGTTTLNEKILLPSDQEIQLANESSKKLSA